MTPTDKQNLWNAILKLNNKPYIGSGYPAYNNVKNPALRGGLYTWKYRDMRNLFNEIVKYCDLGQSEAVWRVLLSYKTKIYPAYLRNIFQALTCGAAPFTTVGTQVWSTKNLNVTTYRNGDPIPFATNQSEWDNYAATQTGAYRYYNDDPTYETIYGKWYNSYAMQDPRNLAPSGYHLPTYWEWDVLNNYLGTQSQVLCGLKDTMLNVWTPPNTDAANLYDFEIVPGGGINAVYGTSYGMAGAAYYWIYTLDPTYPLYAYFLFNGDCSPNGGATNQGLGMTARIISNSSLVRGQLFGGGILLENTGTEGITGYYDGGAPYFSFDFWGCSGILIGAGDSQDGYSNTQAMLSNACNGSVDYIASSSNYTNGYNDWYIPAADEILRQIHEVPEYEALLDPTQSYWTSTEVDNFNAFTIINPSNTPGVGNWILKQSNKSINFPFFVMRKQTL
jgi:uncharacterized protein (TIGR02145 family)